MAERGSRRFHNINHYQAQQWNIAPISVCIEDETLRAQILSEFDSRRTKLVLSCLDKKTRSQYDVLSIHQQIPDVSMLQEADTQMICCYGAYQDQQLAVASATKDLDSSINTRNTLRQKYYDSVAALEAAARKQDLQGKQAFFHQLQQKLQEHLPIVNFSTGNREEEILLNQVKTTHQKMGKGLVSETLIIAALEALLELVNIKLDVLSSIEVHLKQHSETIKNLKKHAQFPAYKKVKEVKRLKDQLPKMAEEVEVLSVKIKHAKNQSDKETLMSQLNAKKKHFHAEIKKHDTLMAELHQHAGEYLPELFTIYDLDLEDYIDSKGSLDSFANVQVISTQGNHHIFQGELHGVKYVLKKYSLMNDRAAKRFKKEVEILKRIHHPRIISINYTFITELHEGFLVMPFYPHNFSQWLQTLTKMEDMKLQKIWRGICHGLEYLHHMGIIHRDIKPQNILIDHNDESVIADFDVCTTEDTPTITTTSSPVGTLEFMAPEVKRGERARTAADMYSFGRVIEVSNKWHTPNSHLEELLQALLALRPERRPNASQVLLHPYFTNLLGHSEEHKLEERHLALENECQELQKLEQHYTTALVKLQVSAKGLDKNDLINIQEAEKRATQELKEVRARLERNKEAQEQIKKQIIELYNKQSLVIPPWYWKLKPPIINSATFIEYDVTNSMKEKMQQTVDISCVSRTLGQGRDMNHRQGPYSRLEVVRVIRVEHPQLWQLYVARRKFIKAHSPHKEVAKPANYVEWMDQSGLDPSVNELFLFHGTKPDVIGEIKSQGFDERVSRIGGLFGLGIYFGNLKLITVLIPAAENSSKSDQYVTPTDRQTFFMFLSRVCLGTPKMTSKPQNVLRRPPPRKDQPGTYDSVVGKPAQGRFYKEFVVYDRTQCYPEFVIEYRRTSS